MSERVQTRAASDITGLKVRGIQAMASRGEIPGAAKLGRVWTFNETELRRWIRRRESEVCRTSIVARESGMPEYRLPAMTEDEAYEQAIGLKQKSA